MTHAPSVDTNNKSTAPMDKAMPGAIVGMLIGSAISPSLPVVVIISIIGGITSYITISNEEQA